MSALGRMASGDHRHITIAPGDTVVLASSLVPGNETSVYRVINRLARAGAVVVHKDVAKVHVSGHAPAGELLYLLNVVRPSNLMPVHGEWRHLRAHARLGIESGVAADRVVICEDGDVVDLVEGRASLVGHVKSRYVYVDGLAVGDVSESLLTERRILGDGGFIATTVVVDSVTGKVVAGPTLSAKGFSEDPEAFNPVIPLVTEALNRAAADGITDPHQLQQIVRRTVGRWVNDKYRRRPMIVPDRRRGLSTPADAGPPERGGPASAVPHSQGRSATASAYATPVAIAASTSTSSCVGVTPWVRSVATSPASTISVPRSCAYALGSSRSWFHALQKAYASARRAAGSRRAAIARVCSTSPRSPARRNWITAVPHRPTTVPLSSTRYRSPRRSSVAVIRSRVSAISSPSECPSGPG